MAATIKHIEVNGLDIPVIFEEDKRLPLVTMQFIFTNSGSITDTKKAGLAKFSAKVLNEGTKKLGSSKFAESLESKAISLHSSTGVETFVVEVSSLKEQFNDALKKLSSLLQDPNTTQKTVSKVKTMIVGSLSRKENDFDYIASNALKSILFKGNVLANPSSGTIKSVESIDVDDVKEFIASHITASNLIVVMGGDIDLKSAKKEIAKIVEKLPKGKATKLKHYETNSKAEEIVLKKETQQAYIYFGSPYDMLVGDKDYYKARVATYILGTGGFGSRLMEEIRVKRGLAYSAYARVNITKSRNYFSGYLQTKLESLKEAQTTINSVIAKFVKDGVTKDELEQTKKFLLGSEPLRVESMSQRLNRTFMEYYNGHKLGYSQKELTKIKNLKLEDLNKFIKKHKEINDLSYAIVEK